MTEPLDARRHPRLFSIVNACVAIGVGGIVLTLGDAAWPPMRTMGATCSSQLEWARRQRAAGAPLTEGQRMLLAEHDDERAAE